MKTGIELIAEERTRQLEVEGWTPEHDQKWENYELNSAAVEYMKAGEATAMNRQITVVDPEELKKASRKWPWAVEWWKPSEDPVRNLVKAGALIAAEIDRLQSGNVLAEAPSEV